MVVSVKLMGTAFAALPYPIKTENIIPANRKTFMDFMSFPPTTTS